MPCQSVQRRCILTQGCEFVSEDLKGNLEIPPFEQLKVSLLPNEKLDVLNQTKKQNWSDCKNKDPARPFHQKISGTPNPKVRRIIEAQLQ